MSSYNLELPHLSSYGSHVHVHITDWQGRLLIIPTPVAGNLLEVYRIKAKSEDIVLETGEEWEVEILEHEITTKLWGDSFELFHKRLIVFLYIKLLRRVEETTQSLDRAKKEWVVETKSGLRVVDTKRIPVRIFRAERLGNDKCSVVEKYVGRDDGVVYFEGIIETMSLETYHAREREKLRANARLHPSQRK